MITATLNREWPDTMHGLLARALDDLARYERDPNVLIDMGVYLQGATDERPWCNACLAGCALLGSGYDPMGTRGRILDDVPVAIREKMMELDRLRVGIVRECDPVRSRWVPDYHADREAWWEAMRDLHAELELHEL